MNPILAPAGYPDAFSCVEPTQGNLVLFTYVGQGADGTFTVGTSTLYGANASFDPSRILAVFNPDGSFDTSYSGICTTDPANATDTSALTLYYFSTASSSTSSGEVIQTVDNPNLDLLGGVLLFLTAMICMIWLVKKH